MAVQATSHARATKWSQMHACCRYFDFVNFNTTGYRPYVTTLYAVLLGCLRKSISRILVLIVSMGFGVVLPYLGAIQHKVTCIRLLGQGDKSECTLRAALGCRQA